MDRSLFIYRQWKGFCFSFSQINKTDISSKLRTLCADLLRYGAKARIFKGYRTDALADASMTAEHKTYLTDLDSVIFNNNSLELSNGTEPSFEWIGKGLNPESGVGLVFRFKDTSNTPVNEECIALDQKYC